MRHTTTFNGSERTSELRNMIHENESAGMKCGIGAGPELADGAT